MIIPHLLMVWQIEKYVWNEDTLYGAMQWSQTKPVACQDFETNSIFVVSMFMFQYYISKTTFEKGKIAKVI